MTYTLNPISFYVVFKTFCKHLKFRDTIVFIIVSLRFNMDLAYCRDSRNSCGKERRKGVRDGGGRRRERRGERKGRTEGRKGEKRRERRKKETKFVLGLEEMKPRINNAESLLRGGMVWGE